MCEAGGYYYPRRALRAAETPDGRLSKRLICRFLRSGGRSSPHDSSFLANTQNFLLAVPVANAFALWYDKFSKSEFGGVLMYEVSKAFHRQYADMYDKFVRIHFKDGSVRTGLFNDEFYDDSSILVSCEVIKITDIDRMELLDK